MVWMALVLFSGCDPVAEDERFLHVDPVINADELAQRVLIEDFTGQLCVNCPPGHELIEQMQAVYGADNLIAVSIHGGPLSTYSRGKVLGLRTQLGDDYNTHWGVDSWPNALINRRGGSQTADHWQAAVHDAMGKIAPMSLELESVLDPTAHIIHITVTAKGKETFNGNLQVWIVEDNITAIQKLPDGSSNPQYTHNNVLRTAVNGAWGTDFAVPRGEIAQATFEATIDEKWNAQAIRVVAFTYDADGVAQAVSGKVAIGS